MYTLVYNTGDNIINVQVFHPNKPSPLSIMEKYLFCRQYADLSFMLISAELTPAFDLEQLDGNR